jgi:hypothetical protein
MPKKKKASAKRKVRTGTGAKKKVARRAHARIAMAPLFICPEGDQSSPTASICSVHLVRMIPAGD